jgi:hypothetical protein
MAPLVTHYKCRNVKYPRCDIARFPVSDEQVSWNVEYLDYNPPEHTDANAKGKPWSDPDVE